MSKVRKPTPAQLDRMRGEFKELARTKGPYAHNIVSASLRIVAQKHGDEVADQMIEEFSLTKRFGIQQEIPLRVMRAIEE